LKCDAEKPEDDRRKNAQCSACLACFANARSVNSCKNHGKLLDQVRGKLLTLIGGKQDRRCVQGRNEGIQSGFACFRSKLIASFSYYSMKSNPKIVTREPNVTM